ncbi:glycoside hydrolase family 19 protein [Hymenobacter sp. YC55]|uniref:glycoside hydrolase family 19 protein n=1 Tax=Hymenobacter sp. YC55 TaxID=3034019 RepID=UPI0023F7C313|nr:glycoside hydrolase family 19 protein [Hymenobacter sp. YC55]MDF7810684.1 glycoside hydrolase family 19 protein [Hymenobacter sp. YC55]
MHFWEDYPCPLLHLPYDIQSHYGSVYQKIWPIEGVVRKGFADHRIGIFPEWLIRRVSLHPSFIPNPAMTPAFYDHIRLKLFSGRLNTKQVTGIEAIGDYYHSKYKDLESLAYIFATVYHETAKTFEPIREYGHGAKYDYGKQLKMGKGPGKRVPYTHPVQFYYGRGFVQLTWYENYDRVGQLIGKDLLNNPDLLLTLGVSVKVLVEGMVGGWFTGRKLADYFAGPKADALNARRIINGMDQAKLIAGYYDIFLDALAPGISSI